MKFLQILKTFILSVLGILLMGGLPVLVSGLAQNEWRFRQYWMTIGEIIDAILHPSGLTYKVIGGQKERDLFPYLWEPIQYSLTVLFSSFFLSMLMAALLTIFTMMFSEKIRDSIKFVFYLFESLPDLLIILLLQLALLYSYKQTGAVLVGIAATYEEKIYVLPIIVLSILPTIQLYRLTIMTFEKEEKKDYVLLAKSIGLGRLFILIVHILRNAVISVFFQSKKTVWFMLSNLFVVELLFNIPGITRFLMATLQPKLFTLALLSIFVPLFLFYNLGEYILSRKANRGEEL
ncbi:ABC transporter permease subunit [Rossellomorea aquimaris]|uniref:ABC transporter permease subunit n=1 Tax=Rossellomorea aquimaris TaxID=189382 RepID=UPI001CD34AF3|nr:ABC transporter permease subunit [Rossellomorea aquimaris]MCA1055340.1 ABC transporter permease subunit [Rossellomorea aquimaris]